MSTSRGRRGELHTIEVREQFGFLYRGYRPALFFWEFVVLARKLLVIVVLVFMKVLVASFFYVAVSLGFA